MCQAGAPGEGVIPQSEGLEEGTALGWPGEEGGERKLLHSVLAFWSVGGDQPPRSTTAQTVALYVRRQNPPSKARPDLATLTKQPLRTGKLTNKPASPSARPEGTR